jgi:uncharacterized protein (TIGR03435 family)
MKLRSQLAILLLGATTAATHAAFAQQPAPQAPAAALPSFEVATIKPSDPKRDPLVGFLSQPGGRISLQNTTLKTVLYFAFNIPEFQISGGPAWVYSDRYTIEAVPPDSSESRTAYQPAHKASPSGEQQTMLQSLLRDRFALKYRIETREGPVYLLTRGTGNLLLTEPKYKDADSRSNVMNKRGIYDGEAFGQNISMTQLATVLTSQLGLPVIDQTGITGSWDFHLSPDDPTNTDREAATFDAMHRLGLNLKRSKGPVETLVIDHIERPTEN